MGAFGQNQSVVLTGLWEVRWPGAPSTWNLPAVAANNRERAGGGLGSGLGPERLGLPAAGREPVAHPVVEAVGPALPELDLLGHQPVAAPVMGAGHLGALKPVSYTHLTLPTTERV